MDSGTGDLTQTLKNDQLQLIKSYEACGKYEEAVNKGFLILGDNISDEKEDELFEILVTIMRCFLLRCNNNNASNVQHDYERLLSTLKQLNPLIIRCIHQDNHKQLITSVITYLGKCTLFLVRERTKFDGKLVLEFCDQMGKFGRDMCHSVCLHFNTFSVEILNCVLPLMAQACEIGQGKSLVDFLNLVDYVAIRCRNATDCCVKVQSIFNILASSYFPEVKELPVGLILKLYAMALSLNTVEQDLVKMDNGLRSINIPLETTTAHLYFLALNCLCEPLYRLIISKQEDILFERIKVPNIKHALQQFRRVCSKYSESKEGDVNKKDSETIATVAAASFTLEFGTNNNSKETTDFLKDVLSADWIQAEDLKCLIDYLYKTGTILNKVERTEEATESLKLCCQAASERILSFCNRFLSKDDDHLEGDIVPLVELACKASSFMLKILSKDGSKNISWVLTDFLRSWSLAQQVCDKIPPPKDLLKQWVHILCKELQGPEVSDSIPTVYSLMSSEMSKEALGILVEQEIQAFKNMKPVYPKSRNAMLRITINILYKHIYHTKDRLEESKNLTRRAKHFRECGVEFLAECESSMSEAISIMTDLYNERNGGHHLVCQLLAEAYCIRALCSQEAKPDSKDLIEDVLHAIKLWSDQEHSKSAEQTCTVFEKDLTLLYHVCDLLSLKGYLEIHSEIYETMIKCFNPKNVGLKDWWAILLKSRSLGHGLCASPVNDVFMSTLSKPREELNSVKFWTGCMENLEPHTVGIRHSLSILPTLSSLELYNGDHATQQYMPINKVEEIASNLIKKGPVPNHSLFVAAHIYYDLAETMIAKGSMIKALSYAKAAHSLRRKLMMENFILLDGNVKEILSASGEVIENKYVITAFSMRSTVATAVWSHDKGGSSDFEGFILTPWNLLQCYLESTLQFGNLVEYSQEAEVLLLIGKGISDFLSLPIFSISFSSALGKLYRKLQKWNLAEKELQRAKSIWMANHSHISCMKCKTMLEVSINLELGDLHLDSFYSNGKTRKELNEADCLYRDAAEWLKRQEWVNSVSYPEEATARNTTFCDAIGILSDTTPRGCEDNCWHCQPFNCMKSTSFQMCIDMKWECIRRRLLLRLLTGRGKCYGALGVIQDEKKVLFDSISILVSRSTFRESQLSVTSNFVTTLIEKNVMGIAFSIDHASILFQICCYFLKCISKKDTSYTISKPTVVSGLKLAFILSREVPTLHQKVSRILSVLYTSDKELSTCNDPSANQWASYFHKSSIGSYLNNAIVDRAKDRMKVINSCLPTAHSSIKDLEESVLQFYKDLPCVTILCISLLGDNSDGLLRDLLPHSSVSAWMMLSRLNSTNVPIVVILPVGSTFTDPGSSLSFTIKSSVNPQCCRWAGATITDKVAPIFKSILEELNRIYEPNGLNDKDRSTRMDSLDQCLSELLSDMEKKWFGRWKQLLWGEWSDYKNFDCRLRDLLKSEYEIDADINIIRIVLEGAGEDTPKEEFLSDLISSKGCYIDGVDSHDHSIDRDRFTSISRGVSKTLRKMKGSGSTCRKPIILVLDLEIQMLPLESMPILRNQDVYRMPSVISISSTFYRGFSYKDMGPMIFPTIDPRDAYYLLNPQGDLISVEKKFEAWFEKLKLKGEVGTSNTKAELGEVLRSRDLFIYIGHGSGLDCISVGKIGKLDRCAAVVLMGCSSGSLALKGQYIPKGVVLDYILAGAPVIVCNLWDVLGKNADKFTTTLLRSWIISKDKANIGSSIGNARDSCYSPFIQGGSLVCYGVPTGIIIKKDM